MRAWLWACVTSVQCMRGWKIEDRGWSKTPMLQRAPSSILHPRFRLAHDYFPHHLPCFLVLAQPLVRSVLYESALGPAAVLDLDHQLGLQEARPRPGHGVGEWTAAPPHAREC